MPQYYLVCINPRAFAALETSPSELESCLSIETELFTTYGQVDWRQFMDVFCGTDSEAAGKSWGLTKKYLLFTPHILQDVILILMYIVFSRSAVAPALVLF